MKNIKFLLFLLIFLEMFLTCKNSAEPDTTPPVVSIQSPLSGETVSEVVVILVSTSDNEEIEKVEFIIDDSLHFTDSQDPYEYSWNTSTLTDGSHHTVKVISYDTSNNSTKSQPILLTVDNSNSYPTSIDITSIILENGNLILTWNKSYDPDFDSYKLEKSLQSNMEEFTVINTTNEITDTTYTDTDINPLAYQYYRIAVRDTVGLEVKGQIVSSSLDPVPTQVNVISVSYSLEEMTVIWEESQDDDFRDYELLYSETEIGEKETLVTYTGKSTTSHIITDFNPTHENWFWINVTDTLDQSTIGNGLSNEVDNSPTPINIATVSYDLYEMEITWNQSTDNDFVSYELLYSESETGEKTTLKTTTDLVDTIYITTDFDPTHENWFWVKVTDYWDLTTLGDGQLVLDSHPSPVIILSVTYDLYEMIVQWDTSPDDDFLYYELLYSESEQGNKTLLTTITDKSTTSFTITEFDPTHENWFWIRVTDYWELTTIGNGYIVIDSPPTEPELHSVQSRDNSFYISWSQNNDSDFASYTVYESMNENMNGQIQIFYTTEQNILEYISPLNDIEFRYYQIVVEDIWGLETSSSIVRGSKKIVFTRYENIYTMDIDGSSIIELTNIGLSYDPRFSSDGSTIVFKSISDGLYIVDVYGGNLTNITNTTGAGRYPQFSPDGMKILFNMDVDIYIINTDGSNLVNLTDSQGIGGHSPQFSPDGSKIAYVSGIDPVYNIYIMNVDGSNQINLTNNSSWNWQPSFSPDGSKIVFSRANDIFIINVDGSNQINLTNNTDSDDHPQFSPDGSDILFLSDRDSFHSNYDIFVMNSDGSNQTNITNSSGWEGYPQYSLDGTKIVFQSDQGGFMDIHVINFDGSNRINLTNHPAYEISPQFQP